MPYISGIELGRNSGASNKASKRAGKRACAKVWLEGLALGLELKFGAAGKKLLPRFRRIEDVAPLQALHRVLKGASNLDELRKDLP